MTTKNTLHHRGSWVLPRLEFDISFDSFEGQAGTHLKAMLKFLEIRTELNHLDHGVTKKQLCDGEALPLARFASSFARFLCLDGTEKQIEVTSRRIGVILEMAVRKETENEGRDRDCEIRRYKGVGVC
ncbi:hypothetical protein L2E82_11954 [Cichorium intybus]|uniref:Uncharacterized protein n=1 Tax=Cichorium intybus TaxID=13427 RepID=A0ACB9GFD6_CICIN|nr:hypothetical protein L2E82_11954 [Cichorium intybus]